MPKFKKITPIPSLKAIIDYSLSKYFIYADHDSLKTVVVIYIAVLEGYEVEFIDIETIAVIPGVGRKIIKKHYKDVLNGNSDLIKAFKKGVMKNPEQSGTFLSFV
jgi:hypothetical protein